MKRGYVFGDPGHDWVSESDTSEAVVWACPLQQSIGCTFPRLWRYFESAITRYPLRRTDWLACLKHINGRYRRLLPQSHFLLEVRNCRFPAHGALFAHELTLVMDHISEERQRRTPLSAESIRAIHVEAWNQPIRRTYHVSEWRA